MHFLGSSIIEDGEEAAEKLFFAYEISDGFLHIFREDAATPHFRVPFFTYEELPLDVSDDAHDD